MSEKNNDDQNTETQSSKRKTFEILDIDLDCSGGYDQPIDVACDFKFNDATCRDRRLTVDLTGNFPDGGYEYTELDDDTAESNVTITFTEQQERELRAHISAWLLRIHFRLDRALHGRGEHSDSLLHYAKSRAKTLGYEWDK
jgi:hypothetical protein